MLEEANGRGGLPENPYTWAASRRVSNSEPVRTVTFDKPITHNSGHAMVLDYSFSITPVGLADTVVYIEPNFPENTKQLVEFCQKSLFSVLLSILQG